MGDSQEGSKNCSLHLAEPQLEDSSLYFCAVDAQ